MTPITRREARTLALVAMGLLGMGWLVAVQRPVPGWELDLARAINDAPEASADGLWPVMQLGTLGGPLLVAVALAARMRWLPLAAAVVTGGVLAWFAAKAVKRIVERGRPLEYLAEIDVREGLGTGLGFVSGHTAVAFACAAVIAPELSWPGKTAVFLTATVVGVARIVHGVHLPADVLGGAGLGLLCGLGARLLVERLTAAGAADRGLAGP